MLFSHFSASAFAFIKSFSFVYLKLFDFGGVERPVRARTDFIDASTWMLRGFTPATPAVALAALSFAPAFPSATASPLEPVAFVSAFPLAFAFAFAFARFPLALASILLPLC